MLVTAVATIAYRGYAATRRRHQSLELMHSFVADGVGAESVDVLIEQLLTRIRTLMNAGTAELRIFPPVSALRPGEAHSDLSVRPADIAVRMAVSEEPGLHSTRGAGRPG